MKSNLDLANIKIETKRLVMVPVSLKFAPEIFQEFTDEITTYSVHRKDAI